MTGRIFDRNNVSSDALADVLLRGYGSGASVAIHKGSQGELRITEPDLVFYVRPIPECDVIKLFQIYRLDSRIPNSTRMELLNRLNSEAIMVRGAIISGGSELLIHYDIVLGLGIYERQFLVTLGRFKDIASSVGHPESGFGCI